MSNIETLLRRANIRGIELRPGIEAFAHRLCAALGLPRVTIQWAGISTAAINACGNMVLANVADDAVIGRATVARYAGFVLHELLHRKYTTFSVRGNGQYVQALHNAVEDAWIEGRCIRDGLVGNAAGLLSALVDSIVGEALAEVSDWSDTAQYPFALAIYLRDHATRKVPLARGLRPIFDEAHRRLSGCTSSSDTLAIADWVFKQLQQVQQPDNQQPDNQQPDDQQQEGDDAGDDAGNQDAHSDASDGPEGGDQGEGEGEGAGDGKNAPDAPDARPVAHEHQPAREVEPRMDGKPSPGGSFTRDEVIAKDGHHLTNKVTVPAPPVHAPARLRSEVRRMFEHTDRSGYEVNRRAGSINSAVLPRVAAGSDRVFKRHDEPEGIDSAVTVVLDVSSSMFVERNINGATQTALIGAAVQACDALIDSLSAAGVQVEVVTFGVVASVLCPFGTPAARIKHAVRCVDNEGDTNDSVALRLAHERIYTRPEQRKVVFVLTDGDGKGAAVRAQCKAGAALGITTIAIGIGERNQADVWYTNAIKVVDPADLASAALSQIKVAA